MTVHTEGGLEATEQLLDWLRDEDALRGLVRRANTPIGEGDLGAITDVITVAVSSGITVTALARSLTTWLTHRRSDLDITVTRGDASVKIKGKRLDADTVLRRIRDLTDPTEPPR